MKVLTIVIHSAQSSLESAKVWHLPPHNFIRNVAPTCILIILNNSTPPCHFHFRCNVFKASWTQLMSLRQGIWAQKPRAVTLFRKQQIVMHLNLILEIMMLNLHRHLLQKGLRTGKSLSKSVHTTVFPKVHIAKFEVLVSLFVIYPYTLIMNTFCHDRDGSKAN